MFCRPVERVQFLSFSAENVTSFFVQEKLVFRSKEIKHGIQVCHLDETGFTTGRDLVRECGYHVIVEAFDRAVKSFAYFQYKTRISVITCVLTEVHKVLPAAMFKGNRESSISNFMASYPVSELLKSPWKRFWIKGKTSFDGFTFFE